MISERTAGHETGVTHLSFLEEDGKISIDEGVGIASLCGTRFCANAWRMENEIFRTALLVTR